MTREVKKQRSMTGITKRTYNNFSALENEIECSICNNFGHEYSECRSRIRQTKEHTSSSRTWRIKEPQPEICGIAFYAEGQENLWYIDNGCSKHMTGGKEKLESYTTLEKGKKVSFGNDTPTAIKGKGTAQLKEKVKAENVLYVDGLKHNLLSVSQMCDNGTEVIFQSDGCSVRDLDTGRTVNKGKRNPNNLYIFEEGQQQCYLSKDDEHWLWHQRMVWLGLMKHKDEAFEKFKSFKALVENESDYKIKCLRSDRGGEFTSNEFFDFCEEHGIRREFSIARTLQQNGVVERMNRTVQQMARAMLDESRTPTTFWGEAAFVVVVILNKTNVRLGKLEPRADEGILLGYSHHNKAYKCYNKRIGRIVDSIDVVVDEKGYIPRQVNYENIEEDEDYPQNQTDDEEETHEEETHEDPEEKIRIKEKTPSRYVQKNHPESQILGQKEAGVQTRRTIAEASSYFALLSSTELKNVKEACEDECWVKAMDGELE
eukprot:PITA_30036